MQWPWSRNCSLLHRPRNVASLFVATNKITIELKFEFHNTVWMISPCDVDIVWILKEAEVLTSLSLSATLLALLHCAHLSSRSEYRWDAQCALDTLANGCYWCNFEDLLSPSQCLDPQAGSRHQSKVKNELLGFSIRIRPENTLNQEYPWDLFCHRPLPPLPLRCSRPVKDQLES